MVSYWQPNCRDSCPRLKTSGLSRDPSGNSFFIDETKGGERPDPRSALEIGEDLMASDNPPPHVIPLAKKIYSIGYASPAEAVRAAKEIFSR